jgi:hypothetical protein
MSDQGGKECAALIVREFSVKRREILPECQAVQISTILQAIVLQVLEDLRRQGAEKEGRKEGGKEGRENGDEG